MQPTMTNEVNADQAADAPITRDELIEQAFCGKMSRKELLSEALDLLLRLNEKELNYVMSIMKGDKDFE